MAATLGDLTPRDIGRQVAITTSDGMVTGTLRRISVETEWIPDYVFGDRPWQAPGRRTVSVQVGPWSASALPIDSDVEMGGEGGAADDERAVLNRLRALSVDRDEYLLRLRQAEHIAQVGGVDDETLRGLLHIAVAGQVTPSAERALRRVGIDVRCHDHDYQQHDERPVSGAGMGERG